MIGGEGLERNFLGRAGKICWQVGLAVLGLLLGTGCEPAPTLAGAQPRAEAAKTPAATKPVKRPPLELIWPTPNRAFTEGRGPEAYIQPTASGEMLSGQFGSVRSGGRQFHEGLDLFPLLRDRQGEALDDVFAVMAGSVRHVSSRPGSSSYGRYVVLEHPAQSPPVYTLYAHLESVAAGLQVGQTVQAGQRIARMGRSAGGYSIPKERAHLHLEIGVRMTDNFAAWYRARGFGSPNEQGLYNGMNLMGIDPLEVFRMHRAGELTVLDDYFTSAPTAVTLRIARATEPDFIRRYPSLVARGGGGTKVDAAGGWEIDFSPTGVPLRWRRLEALDLLGWRPGELRIIAQNDALLTANRGRTLVVRRAGKIAVGQDLNTVLELLFK
jgi:peptidoglycan LD-endopeptidase LytH